ncbi:TPA: hypothetical protein ACH3X3_004809 [Trebouxia sp. C0006]
MRVSKQMCEPIRRYRLTAIESVYQHCSHVASQPMSGAVQTNIREQLGIGLEPASLASMKLMVGACASSRDQKTMLQASLYRFPKTKAPGGCEALAYQVAVLQKPKSS